MMKKLLLFWIAIVFLSVPLCLPGCGGGDEPKEPEKAAGTKKEETTEKTGTEDVAPGKEEKKKPIDVAPDVAKYIKRLSWEREGNKMQVADAALWLADHMKYPSKVEGIKTAIPKLKELLEDSNADVRAACAQALLYIGGKEMSSTVSALLKNDAEEEVRRAVVVALDQQEDLGNMNLFIQCIEDESPRVAAAAIHALDRIGASGAAATIHQNITYASDGELISTGIRALVKFEYDDAAKDIADFLSFDNEGVRMQAALALTKLETNSFRVLKHLIKAMEEDEILLVRKHTYEAFQKITGEKMIFNYEEVDEESRIEEMIGFREWLEKNKDKFEK